MAENTYKIDFNGRKECYSGARKSYREGETVHLEWRAVGTDTDYSFLLDGKPLKFRYEPEKGFIIEFTMPAHDVSIKAVVNRSMTALDPSSYSWKSLNK